MTTRSSNFSPGNATPDVQIASNLNTALNLAAVGVEVFPCSPDKRPLVEHWRERSTTDAEKILAWWGQHPSALVAIDCGKSGLVVIDCDRKPGAPDGVAAFRKLAADNLGRVEHKPPQTRTLNNGVHVIFRQPSAGELLGNSRGNLPDGIDVRGAGGYIIAPGSQLLDGRGWMAKESTPAFAEVYAAETIPEVPAWLLALLRPIRQQAGTNGNGAAYSAPPGAASPREVAYAKAALAGIHGELSRTAEGARNEALNKAAFRMGTMVGAGWIGEDGVRSALTDAATRCGLDQREASATISSGLKAAMADPHPPLEDQNFGQHGHLNDAVAPIDAPAPQEWTAPRDLPINLTPVEPFDQDLLPEQIAPWVMDISHRMQCPPDFVAVSAVIAMGSLIGRKIGIRPQNKTDWLEVPNLWGCIVGRPGVMKSPAMKAALAPLERLEALAREAADKKLREYERELELYKIRKSAAHEKAKAAFRDDSSASAGQFLGIEEPVAPKTRRYISHDSTYEALGAILVDNANGILVHRDELVALLRTLDREDNAAGRGFYLQAWSGTGSYTFDRIMRGKQHIEGACISLLGSTQPGKLTEYVSRAIGGGAGDDGLIQRFGLLVWPDRSPEWKNVDEYPNTEARQNAFGVFDRLDKLDLIKVKAEHDLYEKVPFLRFTPDAQAKFVEWHTELEHRLRSGDFHPTIESHLAKYRKLVPALALIFHLADGNVGPVGLEPTLRAIAWVGYLESHVHRAYGAAIKTAVATAREILRHIKKGDLGSSFTARDVYRPAWAGLSDQKEVEAGLELLCEYNWLKAEERYTGGRPTTVYHVNLGAQP